MNYQFTPTISVVSAMSKGLNLLEGKEIKELPSNIIDVAKSVVEGQKLSLDQVRELKASLTNHQENKEANINNSSNYISWLLSGGNAAVAWTGNIMNAIEQKLSESAVSFDAPEVLLMSSTNTLKIPLAKKGNFKHNVYGEVVFNEEDFNSIRDNYTKNALGFKPYITYGHLVNPEYETVDAELKKGELLDFETRDDVFYGIFSCSEEAYNLASKGEYEYASGEFIRNYNDKTTGDNIGTVITRVALTNSPFIPFNDAKIEVLSNSSNASNNCPQLITPFIVKLTNNDTDKISTITTQIMPNEIVSPNTVPTEVAVPTTEVVVPNAVPPAPVEAPGKEEEKKEEVKEEEVSTSAPTPTVTSNQIDIQALVKQITDNISNTAAQQIQSVKQAAEQTAQQTIDSLKAEVADLKSKIGLHDQVVQGFSTHLQQVDNKARYAAMVNKGISPALVQKYSQIENAISTGSQVIKLSETESTSVPQMIADLLHEAVYSEPVQVEQLGQSLSVAAASGLASDMQRLIQANKDKAAKLKL